MNPFSRRLARLVCTLACAAASGALLAQADGINVVAPTLPPRQASVGASVPAHGGVPAAAAPTDRVQGPQAQPAPAAPTRSGISYGGAAGSAAPSALAAGRAPASNYGYAQQPGQGAAEAPVAAIAARSAAPGNCRAELSPDRQNISLMGTDALPRQHVPLGEFRAQQVIHSPDGRWAVALTKLRGRPQFALVAIDLARCEAVDTLDLPAAADDARFEGDEAVVRIGGGERRVRLSSSRVR